MENQTFDLIVPIHMVDWRFFSSNLNSWLKEIPLNRVFIGCNNSKEDEFNMIKSFVSGFEKVEFIDQRGIKTLGYQIVDLMKRTEGEWFVYCHSDAQLTPFCFKIMEAYMNIDTVGIVESERVHYDGKNDKRTYWNYHYTPRSFSGFQIFRKKAIENILDVIEDDYIYRNEDIILQNVCENNGFEYVKSWSMHIHIPTINGNWSPQGEVLEYSEAHKITMIMQIKGIIKYCTPNSITLKAFLAAFGVCKQHFGFDMYDFVETFVRKVNPVWERAIFNQVVEIVH
jgi:hypothetical protein